MHWSGWIDSRLQTIVWLDGALHSNPLTSQWCTDLARKMPMVYRYRFLVGSILSLLHIMLNYMNPITSPSVIRASYLAEPISYYDSIE